MTCWRALGAAATWGMERDGAWQSMARGLQVLITALLKRVKPQDLEGRTTELLQSAQPLLSWEIQGDCSCRKIAPCSKWGLGGCETHRIVERAGGELENLPPVKWPGPALAIRRAPTDTGQAQHHLLVPKPGTHSYHTWAHTLISTRPLSWAACPGIASPPAQAPFPPLFL